MRTRRGRRGFTLVELLIVVGIIGLLMALLMPAATAAMRAVRSARTRNILNQIELGLKTFHRDFGAYPPSKPHAAGGPLAGRMHTGAANLVYYLCGPAGAGWGTTAGGLMPFNGTAERAYGPYYQVDYLLFCCPNHPHIRAGGGNCPMCNAPLLRYGFLDAFEPPKPILYYCAYRDDNRLAYDAADNPFDLDPDGVPDTGYSGASAQPAAHFELSVMVAAVTSSYPRNDFMLISPGPDGLYGKVIKNEDGDLVSALEGDENATCDDITNF